MGVPNAFSHSNFCKAEEQSGTDHDKMKRLKDAEQSYTHGKQAARFSGCVSKCIYVSISVSGWSVIPLVSSDTGR
jgi:hypothetical protein